MGSGASVTEGSRQVKTGVQEAGPGLAPGPVADTSGRDPSPGSSPAPGPSSGSPPGPVPVSGRNPARDPAPGPSPGPVADTSGRDPAPGPSPGPVADTSGRDPAPGPSSGSPPGPVPCPGPSPGPAPGQTAPAGQSDEGSHLNQTFTRTLQAPEGAEKPDVQSVKREEERRRGREEEERRGEVCPPATVTVHQQDAGHAQDASLDFESFLHDDGTLYSCFNHHGNRVYVDESQNLQPFPEDWISQGRFLSTWDQNVVPQGSAQPQAPPTGLKDDDRAGSVHIRGRGTVMTFMFQERVDTCRFWDPGSGAWLLLPLRWEAEVDFVRARVQRVMSALPGLLDQQEITAALRQCNYDPEEVVSLFGEILLQAPPSGEPTSSELDSFRALLERDRLIEELRQKVQSKEKEADRLLQRNGCLSGEVRSLAEVVQHLNQRLAEVEADRQAARERVRSLQNRKAPAVPPAPTTSSTTKPTLEAGQLRQLGLLSRQLNISNKQLGSTVVQALAHMKNRLRRLEEAVGKLVLVEREAEQLRALYRKEAVERKALYNKLLELQGNIRVFCRCRKTSASASCLETTEEEVLVIQKGSRKKFRFDKVYPQSSTQEDVFAGTLPVITSCVDGYDVCILAYGQTGSGKTFTVMGSKEQPGVNIRSIRELLRLCGQKEKVSYTLKVSMLEIYNETLRDLLAKSDEALLDIRAQGRSVSVPGLSQVQVRSEADILAVMETGEKNRTIASTKMNTQSSRSHLVVALQVEGSDQVSGLASRGTLTLCDLAGSERISKTEAEGPKLVEAAAINRSLTALGQVFSALKCNALHVPFRNSKLTHLLQPCLSGDAKCCVFVNVSPDSTNVVETLSTLQFGSSIRQVSLGKAAPTKSNRAVK